ncbi:murein biosynthesis integral membrane protein MurJ [Corynebacterium sp. H127]|uniref:murein biosynthesis integral membrane protein MurJ n=1 Tax=Corynebacterium sp. H127 TaxID=3133418 RepID=UPI0030A757D8
MDSLNSQTQPQGQRSRIVAPAPPAPTAEPVRRKAPASEPVDDRSLLLHDPATSPAVPVADGAEPSDADLVRSTGSMAVATLISRITGFLRNAMIVWTLGEAISSAFNTANTLPNLITEIVLGAVLTSLVVPVLVRAEKEDADRGEAFIRRLFTLAAALLIFVTVTSVATAPLLTALQLRSDGQVNLSQATAFAVFLLPQIFFYGVFSLFMAILNTKGIFKPGAWAPVVNNLIALATLAAYWLLPGHLDPQQPVTLSDPHVLLLGLGTTFGVIVQAIILLPYLHKAGVNLKPLWGIDDRLKQFGGMALAIIVYVAISQAGYIVTTRIASGADAAAPNIYQQSWLLLQMPYGIIGVTLLTAIMPRLSRRAAEGDDAGVVADLTLGTKLTFLALIPVVVFFTAFGTYISIGLFAYLEFSLAAATTLGWTLSFSAFTLIPYALVLLHLRVFYAREEAWTPTFIIAGITLTKIILSYLAPVISTSPERVVVLLGAANGFGFVAGAVIGGFLLRRHLGSLNGRDVLRSTLWVTGASLVGALAAWILDLALKTLLAQLWIQFGSAGFLVRTALIGCFFLAVTIAILAKSPLEEVQRFRDVVKRKLGRATPSQAAEVSLAVAATESTPIPAPMSAGLVQPPRLLPGAPVLDGRFRLLKSFGVAGDETVTAKFWQAKDLTSGRDVALTFVDTAGASAAASAGAAAEVTRRTRKLAELGHPAIADGIQVVAYRAGCLVIADWVPGSALRAVAELGEANRDAAALALAPLADAAASAHAKSLPLGIDAIDRVRINSEGSAVLAFPAVLACNSPEQDRKQLVLAFTQLVRDEKLEPAEAATVAARLRGESEVPETELLPTVVEKHPEPDALAGFGAKRFSRTMTSMLIGISITLVAIIAVLTAYLMGVVGGFRSDSPVRVDSDIVHTSVIPTPTS